MAVSSGNLTTVLAADMVAPATKPEILSSSDDVEDDAALLEPFEEDTIDVGMDGAMLLVWTSSQC